jgi:hypothetical protein
MKLRIALVVLALVLGAGAASAQTHYAGALGFHDVDAPVGLRWWFSGQKIGLDVGLGFGSEEIADENFSHWALDVGLPVMLKSWDRVHFLVRPGIVYRSQEVVTDPGPPLVTDEDTSLTLQGELEAEVFLADNFSVSAAHGLAIVNTDPAAGGSSTDWGTTGANFTNIGFHVYLFGAK